ncbi:MAG: hypothetical protein IJ699_07540 [Bacteroidaceae bacterium]|nr:hypothetical protein [Bacteroidaceae bacterium]
MKKKILMLPCIAAVAIATLVGKQAYEANAYESNELLMANVEALADNEENISDEARQRRTECFAKKGLWGYASIYIGTVTLERKYGLVYQHGGKEYSLTYSQSGNRSKIPATQYQCQPNPANTSTENMTCCDKQGLFLDDKKIG